MSCRARGRDVQDHDPVLAVHHLKYSESACPAILWVCPVEIYVCTRYHYKRVETKFLTDGSRALVFFRLQYPQAPPG